MVPTPTRVNSPFAAVKRQAANSKPGRPATGKTADVVSTLDSRAAFGPGQGCVMREEMLSKFSVALLDVNGTFMFGEDRFGPGQDYAATYARLGGRDLSGREVCSVVDSVVAHMNSVYLDPGRCDSFPQVGRVLAELPPSRRLPPSERSLLERVIASHEVGHIPEAYADALRTLARTHRLGVVSNIWSVKDLWLQEMRRARVFQLFEAVVFSSDGPYMKPSPRLFELAMSTMEAGASETVFIGDSLRCDVAGAAALGIATVWLDRDGQGVPDGGPHPTLVVRDLLQLVADDTPGA